MANLIKISRTQCSKRDTVTDLNMMFPGIQRGIKPRGNEDKIFQTAVVITYQQRKLSG